MEEDIFYCGEAVSNLDEAAWSCFVIEKEPEKIWRFKTEEEFRSDNRWVIDGSYDSHPYEWNGDGEMNHFIGKPVEPELLPGNSSFRTVVEAKKGKFQVIANSETDSDREYWSVDYKDIIYDYPVL